MSNGWKVGTLGELCEFQRGLTYSKHDEVAVSNNVVLRATNINLASNRLDFSELKYINEKVKVPESKKVKKGSLMICTASGSKSHLGKIAFIDKNYDYAFGGFMGMVTPKDMLEPKYLYYRMTSGEYKDFINELADGVNINNLKFDDLKSFRVPYPTLKEQQHIVLLIDKAFTAIDKAKANTEKNLQNARELFDSHLRSIFEKPRKDWLVRTLGNIGKVSMCKRIFKNQTATVGDIPFYKIGTFGKEPNAYIPRVIYGEYRKKYSFPKKGDVLISASGTIGRRVRYDGEDAYFQDSNIVWIDNDERQVLNDYLYYFYGACTWGATKGATISRLYNDNLKQITIIFPRSLDEQRVIVSKLSDLSEQTKSLEQTYKQKRESLEELKKSILQKAFKGELAEVAL